ncbi:MAG: dTMP kinase [Proteobacteria bacterium]|nr:dTMP kinase [Pseudomonadota bacterium]MDA1355740.1 dTMP kinase [Pseudomonadota bacterium]
MARGQFISFEGGEGAGKSTQAQLLCRRLEIFGIETLATREPGGSPGAEEIRALLVSGQVERWDPLTEALLHNAARHDHVQRTILPALERGIWVITDRFLDSTLAYQGYGQGVDLDKLNHLGELAAGAAMPDLTLILDLPVVDGFARTERRAAGVSRYEQMDRAMHERLRCGFLSIAEAQSARCRVIDGALDTDSVHQAVWQSVQERFKIEAS